MAYLAGLLEEYVLALVRVLSGQLFSSNSKAPNGTAIEAGFCMNWSIKDLKDHKGSLLADLLPYDAFEVKRMEERIS
jgi:hypothetical protein